MAKQVIFTGRVQGVGFRYTTARIATRHAVCGFVRNRSDGTVELVVDGTSDATHAFLEEICSSMDGYIGGRDEREIELPGIIDGFEIRR